MKRFMASLISIGLLTISSTAIAKDGVIWSTCESCSSPESAYYDQDGGTLYLSNIAGAGDEKDGNGWLSKLSSDGKAISAKWVVGLNAPKGMRLHDGILWVCDIDTVVPVDVKSGKIGKRITIKGAKFLNDIAIAPDGTVYASDTVGNAIYAIKDGKASTFMEGEQLESPNGLLFKDGRLYVASWGTGLAKDWSTTGLGGIYYIEPYGKTIHRVTRKPLGNLDGLEIDGDGNFIASDWMAGKIYRVSKDGRAKLIHQGKKGFADIALVPDKDMIVIPEMLENKITAIKK